MTLCSVALVVTLAVPLQSQTIRGFSHSSQQRQATLERKLRAYPEAQRLRSYMKRMAAAPHMAGTPGAKSVAAYAQEQFRRWGLDVRIETFEATLPYPEEQIVEMVAPSVYRANLKEPSVDPGGEPSGEAFNAYSASGDVTAPLVYVNFGLPEDYESLRRAGVDVRGKIVMARYGRTWRGAKPKLAQQHGAAGCILYSDPVEESSRAGVYPSGRRRPPEGIQRGSVIDLPLQVGDPLTPGWPSVTGARRLAQDAAPGLLRIPVVPLSAKDARHLLRALGGTAMPESWRGGLDAPYRAGPGPAVVRLKLSFEWEQRPIRNVIATIPGSEFPDEWILYGNHHDAWERGAMDPVSGAAALMETARSLSELRKTGWKPRRTIKLALWDGEEFALIGSTEWVEKHYATLAANAVAYFNTDHTGTGRLFAGGSTSLATFLQQAVRDVPLPGASDEHPVAWMGLGAGSDFAAFLHHAGIASLNLGFVAEPGGAYHSAYDNLDWYLRFSDGDFSHGRALSQLTATMLVRMAGADLLPFEFGRTAQTMQSQLREVERTAGSGKVSFRELQGELARLVQATRLYEQQFGAALRRGITAGPQALGAVNRSIFQTERFFVNAKGLPGRPWYRHQLHAPSWRTGYGATPLPAIFESVEAGQWKQANLHAKELASSVRAVTAQVTALARRLRGL